MFKKIIKQTGVYSLSLACVLFMSANKVYAETNYDVMDKIEHKPLKVEGPNLIDKNNYEEQAKSIIKIDSIEFPRYIKVKRVTSSSGTYAKTDYADINYKDNTIYSLRTNSMGFMYYGPNIVDETLITAVDEGNVVTDIGSGYRDYTGDVYWNTKRFFYGGASGNGIKVGPIDSMLNFKPATTKLNTSYVLNQWPKYPLYNSPEITGKKASRGTDYLMTKRLRENSEKSSKTVSKFRNEAVRNRIVDSNITRLKGEWRYIGSNQDGFWIGNVTYPGEVIATNASDSPISLDRNWLKLTENRKTQYNDLTATGQIEKVRKRTMDTLVSRYSPLLNKTQLSSNDQWAEYFAISIPYGDNVSAILEGVYRDGSDKTVQVALEAPGRIDMEVVELVIKNDKGEEIFNGTQSTTNEGVESGEQKISTGDKLKLQPGKEYELIATVNNRAIGHDVYNTVLNVLLDSNPTIDKDFISNPSDSDSYGVYVMHKNYEEVDETESEPRKFKSCETKTLDGNVKRSNALFSVKGERLKYNEAGQKMVPLKVNAIPLKGESKVKMSMKFKIGTVSSMDEMKTVFGTNDPNAVQMRFAAQINDKHQISDEIFYLKGIEKATTTVDDLYSHNNTLSTLDWSASQDLSVGGEGSAILKDSKGNKVEGDIELGEDYTLSVKVLNGSKIWGTSKPPKLDYVIKNAATGEIIMDEKSVSADSVLPKTPSDSTEASSTYVKLPIKLPVNISAEDIIVEATISKEHADNFEDWYVNNNKYVQRLKISAPIDLKIEESMGDVVGDGLPKEITVFSGETINLMSEISSNSNNAVGPVKVKFTQTPSNKLVEKQVASLDRNNTQEIGYTFNAPKVNPNEADKIYTVTAEINPEGADRIKESNYNNNKVQFKVRVTGDISKFGCTSIVKNELDPSGKPTGLGKGNTKKVADSEFTSYVPMVTVKRRNIVDGKKGEWYDYPLELRGAQLKVATNEIHEIKEVLFKSKFTTDRYAEQLDRDKIDSEGFIDILRYPQFAKVKAGYGYEIKVKTAYRTNIKEAYQDATSSKMDAILSTGSSVYQEVLKVINILNKNSGYEIDTSKSSMKVEYRPDPKTVTINAENEVLCLVMPNGEVFTSIDSTKKLIENIPNSNNKNDVYDYNKGVEWNYEFTNRNNGMGEKSRKYYISPNTTNTTSKNKYYMRIGTNKLGIGGLTHAIKNGVYDVKDIEIKVYGGKDEDLKNTES